MRAALRQHGGLAAAGAGGNEQIAARRRDGARLCIGPGHAFVLAAKFAMTWLRGVAGRLTIGVEPLSNRQTQRYSQSVHGSRLRSLRGSIEMSPSSQRSARSPSLSRASAASASNDSPGSASELST